MKSKLYERIYPYDHIFYPLQEYKENDGTYVRDFLNVLQQKKPETTESLMYIHIPFCSHHCLYCPFHATTNGDFRIIERYADAIVKELEITSKLEYMKDVSLNAIYFGGGSPSLVPIPALKRMMDAIRCCFNLAADCEWSFEGEPATLANEELLHFLKEQGISRVSYGIQTFNRELRDKLEIAATLEDVDMCTEMAKKNKFDDINADMMYNLPGQTVEDLKIDIEKVHRLGITSVDYYFLSYYGFPKKVYDGMANGSFPLRPSESVRAQMFECVTDSMINLGYTQTLLDQFSKKDTTSKFYQLLWGGGNGGYRSETIAIGCSARGYINGYSYANIREPHRYTEKVMNGEDHIYKVSNRLEEPENRGIVLFTKYLKIEKTHIIGTKYAELFERYLDDELVTDADGYYQLTTKGGFYSPNITIDLFESRQKEINVKWLKKYQTHYNNKTCP